jgi:hypothetical protein
VNSASFDVLVRGKILAFEGTRAGSPSDLASRVVTIMTELPRFVVPPTDKTCRAAMTVLLADTLLRNGEERIASCIGRGMGNIKSRVGQKLQQI